MGIDASTIELGSSRTLDDAPRRHHVSTVRRIRAGYDAAQTHSGNTKHWAEADLKSAGAALTPSVRQILRKRARYECDNNSFAWGMIETIANDCIGTGPRLQLLTEDTDLNTRVERQFRQWAAEVHLARKLRALKMAQLRDGEAGRVRGTNARMRHPVQLDVRNIESEQVADPAMAFEASESDGISYDPWGNPTSYKLLRAHPGGTFGNPLIADEIPAEVMVHYYKLRRPGQLRGYPDITPALPLFAMLRRYTLAVLTSAEIAADLAGVLYTDAAADDDGYSVDPMDTFEVVRGMFTTMPDGWKLKQLEAEQPTSTYSEFRDKVINEIARCLQLPLTVAMGDSRQASYASGRMDMQVYQRHIKVDRHEIGGLTLDRIWRGWLEEAQLIDGYLPQEMRTVNADLVAHEWYWDGFRHVDPDKESKGMERDIQIGRLSIPDMSAEAGFDWEAQQIKNATAMGLSLEAYRKRYADRLLGPVQAAAEPDPEPVEDDEA